MKKLGLAIVGLGDYAKGQILPALTKTQNVYLAGLVDDDTYETRKVANEYHVPHDNIYNFNNFDNIADNLEIDIVYILLPVSLHKEYVVRAAKAGKHIICEKPMSTSSTDCVEMINAVKEANKLLSIGYRMHFEPRHQLIMNLERKGFGKITAFEAAFGCVYDGDPNAWRLKKALAGGGALMDLGIYTIQAARYTIGSEPIAVTASQRKLRPDYFREVDETVIFDLEFANGFKARCKSSFNEECSYIFITTERGPITIQPAFLYDGIKGKTPDGDMELPDVIQQVLQLDNFANCVLNNEISAVSGEEGLKDIRIIEAIYKSLESGKRELVK